MKSKTIKKDDNNNNNDILAKFNNKYHTEINTNTFILDISQKDLDNEGLLLLSEVPLNLFDNVIELNLSQNCISDISPLIIMNFTNLKNINISKNRIENIDAFEKINLYVLETLDLSYNKLKNIIIKIYNKKIIYYNNSKKINFMNQ